MADILTNEQKDHALELIHKGNMNQLYTYLSNEINKEKNVRRVWVEAFRAGFLCQTEVSIHYWNKIRK